MTLIITTKSGKTYKVNSDQQIIRTDINHRPSGQWFFVGILPQRAWTLSKTITYHALKSSVPPLLYKNGRPRYSIVDIDHGTTRMWSEGITNLQWSEQ